MIYYLIDINIELSEIYHFTIERRFNMAQFDEKVALFRRYADKLKRDYPVHAKGNIPSKKIDNAIKCRDENLNI